MQLCIKVKKYSSTNIIYTTDKTKNGMCSEKTTISSQCLKDLSNVQKQLLKHIHTELNSDCNLYKK